jgi:hypothetical protein
VSRSALLRRFPTRPPSTTEAIFPAEVRERYPALADDFAVLDRHLKEEFTRTDLTALRSQYAYRGLQVLMILGSALVSVLGAVQASFGGQRWIGILVAAAGALVAAVGTFGKERDTQNTYLQARVKAERLRAQYFRYLTRVGPYAGADREEALQRAVIAVRRGQEPQ